MREFTQLPDLAVRTLGGSVMAADDEFFAEKENLIKPGPPVFQPAVFGNKGQLYDGWETRRRRTTGYDSAIVRLIELDTTHFKGNAPAAAALRGLDGLVSAPDDPAGWFGMLPRTPLLPDTRHRFLVEPKRATHVRLDIYPDGGMARLRLYGDLTADGLTSLEDRWRGTAPPRGTSIYGM